MKREIKTLDELRLLDGKKITCTIAETNIEDCLVTIQDSDDGDREFRDSVFLLQDKIFGLDAENLKRYKCSWCANSSTFKSLSNIVYEDDMPELVRVKNKRDVTKAHLPSWLEGITNDDLAENPILVYYSDSSEEGAKEYGSIGLLGCVELYDAYSFKILDDITFEAEDYSSLKELLADTEEISWNGARSETTEYQYIVPVKASDWTENKIEESQAEHIAEEVELANQIGEVFVGLGKERIDNLLKLLTQIK